MRFEIERQRRRPDIGKSPGIILEKRFDFSNGFSHEIIDEFTAKSKKCRACSATVASGTKLIKKFGENTSEPANRCLYVSRFSGNRRAQKRRFPRETIRNLRNRASNFKQRKETRIRRVIARPLTGDASANIHARQPSRLHTAAARRCLPLLKIKKSRRGFASAKNRLGLRQFGRDRRCSGKKQQAVN